MDHSSISLTHIDGLVPNQIIRGGGTVIVNVPIFDEDECARIAGKVEALRSKWITRQPGFSTLGVATYLDVLSDKPEENYHGRLEQYNRLLYGEFGDMLQVVKTALESVLKAKTRFEPYVALPGFHIFEESGVSIVETHNEHFDAQYRYLRWPFPLLTSQAISFTLALRLPRLGGGLNVWELTEREVIRLQHLKGITDLKRISQKIPKKRYEYKVGQMVLQLETILHGIAPIPQRFPGDQRLTLQGHGVRDGNEWVLYW